MEFKWPKLRQATPAPVAQKSAPNLANYILGATTPWGSSRWSGDVRPAQAMGWYKQVSAVASAVNLIAGEVGKLRVGVTDGTTTSYSHPALAVLAHPNPFETQQEFLTSFTSFYLAAGNTYCMAMGPVNSPPVELELVAPQEVMDERKGRNRRYEMIRLGSGYANTEFSLGRGPDAGRYLQGDRAELFWLRRFNPATGAAKGLSPLEPIRDEIAQFIDTGRHNGSLLKNGARLNTVFTTGEDLTDDQFTAVEAEISKWHAGADNAGRPLLLAGGGFEVQELSGAARDMDWQSLSKAMSEIIFANYQIPLPFVSADTMIMNNYQIAVEALYDNAVLPNAIIVLAGLTRFFASRFDMEGLALCVDPDSVDALRSRRLREAVAVRKLGVLCDNEIRDRIGYEPYDGGDEIFKPSTMVNVGTDVFTDDQG